MFLERTKPDYFPPDLSVFAFQTSPESSCGATTGIHTGGGGSGGGGLPGSNQGKICSTDIDCVDKDWPEAIVSYIYFTDDAQPSQGVDENNPL